MKKTCKLLLWLSSISLQYLGAPPILPLPPGWKRVKLERKRQKQRWNQEGGKMAEVRRECIFLFQHINLTGPTDPYIITGIKTSTWSWEGCEERLYVAVEKKGMVNSLGPDAAVWNCKLYFWREEPRNFASSTKQRLHCVGFFHSLILAECGLFSQWD